MISTFPSPLTGQRRRGPAASLPCRSEALRRFQGVSLALILDLPFCPRTRFERLGRLHTALFGQRPLNKADRPLKRAFNGWEIVGPTLPKTRFSTFPLFADHV